MKQYFRRYRTLLISCLFFHTALFLTLQSAETGSDQIAMTLCSLQSGGTAYLSAVFPLLLCFAFAVVSMIVFLICILFHSVTLLKQAAVLPLEEDWFLIKDLFRDLQKGTSYGRN